MRIFGTDGIRGKASYLIENAYAFKLGLALASGGRKIVVARDVRLSSPALERELVQGLIDGGAEIILCGVLPTPALAYVSETENADYAVMITASHNPPEYNGLKVFGKGGKLSAEEERELDGKLNLSKEELEKRLNSELSDASGASRLKNESGKRQGFASVRVLEDAAKRYKKMLISQVEPFENEKAYLDLACGCTAKLAASVFELLGCEVVAENDERDGTRVNVNCGATYLDEFKLRVDRRCLGFSFDGDGDRVLSVVDGEVYDGDQTLFALAEHYRRKGRLASDAVVGTVLTNGALESEFALRGITLHRADVGDKFVLEKMRETGAVLGGERSGHTILLDRAGTGDGILAALTLLDAKRSLGKLPRFTPYPSFDLNIYSENPQAYVSSTDFIEKVAEIKLLIGRNGRIVARASGTEPAVRITVEVNKNALEYEKTVKNLFLSKNPQK